jgi:hypothetical protein
MHASVNDDAKRESIDINAFRISTRKYIESKKIDKIIMDNAIDCYLMKNINYFPKSLFQLDNLNIETSQGALIRYNYGDEEINEPKCNIDNVSDVSADKHINTSGFRSETYKHLLISIKNNIKNIIKNNFEDRGNDNNIYIDFDFLKNNMGFNIDNDILMYAIKNIIYPNIFINNKYITRYKDGLLITPIDNNKTNKIIRYNNDILINAIDTINSKSQIASNNNTGLNIDDNKKVLQKIISKLDIDYDDENKTIISLYLNINSSDFKTFINFVLRSYPLSDVDNFDKTIQYICYCLYNQGILIKKEDIPSYKENNNEYIGYINMFSENSEDDNIYIQYNENDKNVVKQYKNYAEYLKHIDELQKIKIRKNIKLFNTKTNNEQNVAPTSAYIREYFNSHVNNNIYIPQDMTNEKTAWGIIVRFKDTYIFKLFSTGKGKKTGRKCVTLEIPELTSFFKELGTPKPRIKKELLCNYIAKLLLDKNKLILFPLYKPK